MNDLRFALRQMIARPGFTLAAVLTLALGIGANTAIFSLTWTVLMRALPYPQPDRIVQVFETVPDGGRNAVSGGAFKDWLAGSTSFEHLATFQTVSGNFSGEATPETVTGLEVSAQFLSVLGVPPRLGRDFAPGEDTPAQARDLVILTDGLWRRRFGGDTDVVGDDVAIDQVPHTVVGVLPPGIELHGDAGYLRLTTVDGDPEEWARAGHWRHAIGRLRADVDAATAQAELRGIKDRLQSQYPPFKRDWSVAVVPMREALAGDARPALLTLAATAAFVLLIACANVSNLLLARGNTRVREMAVRAALGARRGAIARQVLVEGVVLALAGCVAGLAVAQLGVMLLTRMAADVLPSVLAPELHGTALLFAVMVACGSGIASALVPALRASRPDLTRDLKDAGRGAGSLRQHRTRSLLLAAQFAFTLVLLVGAGLLTRSFAALLDTDPGFRAEHTLAFDVSLPASVYPDTAARQRTIADIREKLAALPGVEQVASASSLPLSRSGSSEFAYRADAEPRSDYTVGTDFVAGDFFDAAGIDLLRGRALTAADDRPDAPRVLVINERLANDLYPGEDPIGQRLHVVGEDWEIVGVAASVRHYVMHQPAPPRIYAPHARQEYFVESASFVLRTAVPPRTLADAVRLAVLDAHPAQPITRVRTLQDDVDRALSMQRLLLVLVGLFAVVAVLLACVGIYGAMAHAVGQRARELGIRAALGARRDDLVTLVMRSGIKPSLAGIALGLGGALLLARGLESLLYEVDSRDPAVFAVAVGALALLAALSIWLPARRASAVLPMHALRSE